MNVQHFCIINTLTNCATHPSFTWHMSHNQELTTGYLIGSESDLCVAVERKSCEAEIETAFEFNTALVNKRRKDTTRGTVIESDLDHDFFTYLVNVS